MGYQDFFKLLSTNHTCFLTHTEPISLDLPELHALLKTNRSCSEKGERICLELWQGENQSPE